VTKRLRRVARFDMSGVIRACRYNRPTGLAVMGLDRLDYRNTGAGVLDDLTAQSRAFLRDLEAATRTPIDFVGTGFGTFDVIPMHGRVTNRNLCLMSI
jgi:adenylosuccinate synthase